MDLIDRHRRATGIDSCGERTRMQDLHLVIDDRSSLRPHLGGKGERIGFQWQRLALRTNDVKLVVIAGSSAGDEQLPIAEATHAHRMPPRVPEIEIADHAEDRK